MHPLEPLTAAEVRLAVSILKDAGKVTPTTRFVSVSLKEPPKALVHGRAPRRRRARRSPSCSTTRTNSCYEATVSLAEPASSSPGSTSPACSRR